LRMYANIGRIAFTSISPIRSSLAHIFRETGVFVGRGDAVGFRHSQRAGEPFRGASADGGSLLQTARQECIGLPQRAHRVVAAQPVPPFIAAKHLLNRLPSSSHDKGVDRFARLSFTLRCSCLFLFTSSGFPFELVRTDGTPNAKSFLYAPARRVVHALR
jgi:hypothetical protein